MTGKTLEEVLAQLRDIHAANPVSFWPLAPGWIALMMIAVLTIFVAVAVYRYRTRIRRHVLKQIAQSQSVAELSILLRRVALYLFPRQEVAGLTGEQWLAFLNRTGQTEKFSSVGRCLIAAPYQRTFTRENQAELRALVQSWIYKNL